MVSVLLSICVAGSIVFLGSLSQNVFARNNPDFRIEQMFRNETDAAIVAFTVYGTFRDQDVVNLYSNDVFIKAKAINTSDLIGTKTITIDNISTDVFQTGDNLIVAKIERSGTEVSKTPAFRLVVQEPPDIPTITALINKEQGLIGLNISGDFKPNDIVRVFLNDIEFRATTIPSTEPVQEEVQIASIPIDNLQIGENFFTASIRRGENESEQSEKTDPIVIEEPKKEEPVELLHCASYGEPKKILPKNKDAYDGFGNALSVKDGVLAVSTRDQETYIYTKKDDEDGWTAPTILLEQEFKESGSAERSVMVYDNTTVLIGDPGSGYRAQSAGAVHTYQRTKNGWVAKENIAPLDLKTHEAFGSQIALSGNMLIITATQQDSSGAMYVYTHRQGEWKYPFRIRPEDTAPGQEFGHSISADNTRVAVGAPGDGFGKNGAVYVYTKNVGKWAVEKIIQQNRRQNARFGTEVLLFDAMLFVGAARDDQGRDKFSSGVVYVYAQKDGVWQVVQKLKPGADDVGGEFGSRIVRAGNMLAIGAPKSGVGRRKSGAVYLYKQKTKGAQWTPVGILTPDNPRTGDRFGADVSFDGLDLLVGAYGNDDQQKNIGALYAYTAKTMKCTAEEPETEEGSGDTPKKLKQTPERLLEALEKQKEILDVVVSNATSIASRLGEHIQGVYDGIVKKKENIVIYDESKVLASAQRRAAERRGIIGPGLPGEVIVERVDSIDKVPPPPTEETVRTRNTVIQETESKVGTVIPVTTRDLRLGDVHEDVYRLQVFLNENGYIVARKGVGSPGNETSIFNDATDRALRTFQLVEGLPITGVLDKKTRDVILTRVTAFNK